MPLIVDSGVRSGRRAKAIASGADFVMLGRPFLYAVAASARVAESMPLPS